MKDDSYSIPSLLSQSSSLELSLSSDPSNDSDCLGPSCSDSKSSSSHRKEEESSNSHCDSNRGNGDDYSMNSFDFVQRVKYLILRTISSSFNRDRTTGIISRLGEILEVFLILADSTLGNHSAKRRSESEDEGNEGSESSIEKKRYHRLRMKLNIGAISFMFIVALAYWRNRRKKKHQHKNLLRAIRNSESDGIKGTFCSKNKCFISGIVSAPDSSETKNTSKIIRILPFESRKPLKKDKQKHSYRNAIEVPLSLLFRAAKKGLVERALVNEASIVFQMKYPLSTQANETTTNSSDTFSWKKAALPPKNPNLTSELIAVLTDGGCLDISALPEPLLSKLAPLFLAASPFLYLALLYQMMKRLQKGPDATDNMNFATSDDWDDNDNSHQQRILFQDVAGVDSAKAELGEIVSYLSNPQPFVGLGALPPKGILLHGPPGNGKTLLARAVAGEADADFFASCSGSDFVEIYVGCGAKRVRDLFSLVRRKAFVQWRSKIRFQTDEKGAGFGRRILSLYECLLGGFLSKSCYGESSSVASHLRPPTAVIFIDEIDALAKCRDGIGQGMPLGSIGANDEREQTLNALLSEMDGFNSRRNVSSSKPKGNEDNDGNQLVVMASESDVVIIVIAATNRISILDPAILRPGRFDRNVLVSTPNVEGRLAILKVHSKHVKLDAAVDLYSLAQDKFTGNFSGADLRNIVNEAALLAVRLGSQFVCHDHLIQAVQRVRLMKGHTIGH